MDWKMGGMLLARKASVKEKILSEPTGLFVSSIISGYQESKIDAALAISFPQSVGIIPFANDL